MLIGNNFYELKINCHFAIPAIPASASDCKSDIDSAMQFEWLIMNNAYKNSYRIY